MSGRPLGDFERAQALTGEHAAFNAVVAVRLGRAPEEGTLRVTLAGLQGRHPLLRARIDRGGPVPRFETEGVGEVPVTTVDRHGAEGWQRVVDDELNTPIDAARGPLLRVVRVGARAGQPGEIVLSFHHAAVDAVAITTVVRQLLAGCAPETSPGSTDLATSLALPPAADELVPPAARGWRRALATAGFMGRQLADEIGFRLGSLGARRQPVHPSARCRILTSEVGAELTRALVRRSRREGVGLNSVLNAAMVLAFWADVEGGRPRPLRLVTFADLRPHLRPPPDREVVAGYFAMLRTTVRMRRDEDLWALAGRISERLHRAFGRGERFVAPRLALPMMRMILGSGRMRMGHTALSYGGALRLEGEPLELRGVHAFVSNLWVGPEYTALARLADGRLWWDVVYLDTDMTEGRARRLMDAMTGLLASSLEPATAEGP